MTLEQQLAEVVALEIAAALEPLQRKVAVLEASAGELVDRVDVARRTIADLEQRLAVAEARPPLPGPPGADGRDGLDGKDGRDGLAGKNGLDGATGLNGKDGAAGLDGKDGANGLAGADGRNGLDGLQGKAGLGLAGAFLNKDGLLVVTLSDGAVLELGVVRGEPGRDGVNGTDGADGLNGKDGRDGLDGKDGTAGLNGKDGRDGLDGKDGTAGLNGKDGRDGLAGVPGRDGLDGKDGAPGLDGKDGADGLAGTTGKDGKDGLGFEDFDLTFDDLKGWQVTFSRPGMEAKTFILPVPFDAGVWSAGRPYPKGAAVTRQGSLWIAQRPTTARPGDESEESRAWRLSVKGGKDGKPGRDGRDGSNA